MRRVAFVFSLTFVLLWVAMLFGCVPVPEQAAQDVAAQEAVPITVHRRDRTTGDRIDSFRLDDGTRCVRVTYYSVGVALDCDFSPLP